jgi:hypothetical protein
MGGALESWWMIGMGELRLRSFEGETIRWSLLRCRMQGLNNLYSFSSFLREENIRGLMQWGFKFIKDIAFYILGVLSRMSVLR